MANKVCYSLKHEELDQLFAFFLELMDLFTMGPNNLGHPEKFMHMIDSAKYRVIHLQAQWIALV